MGLEPRRGDPRREAAPVPTAPSPSGKKQREKREKKSRRAKRGGKKEIFEPFVSFVEERQVNVTRSKKKGSPKGSLFSIAFLPINENYKKFNLQTRDFIFWRTYSLSSQLNMNFRTPPSMTTSDTAATISNLMKEAFIMHTTVNPAR